MQSISSALPGSPVPVSQYSAAVTAKPKFTLKKRSFMAYLRSIGTVSIKEVVEFTRHFAVMLSAGVTLFEALQFLKDNTRNPVFKDRLDRILEMLNNGQPLSAALHQFPKIFPLIYVNIIRVGEQSGTLPDTMVDLANHMEENEKFKSKVKGALIYPKIIVAVMVIFILVLAFFVMPRIVTIFQSLDAQIPFTMQFFLTINDFLRAHVIMTVLAAVGAFFGIKAILIMPVIRNFKDHLSLKLPFFGETIVNYNVAQIAQHFGTLLESGLTILQCLEISKTVISNSIYQGEIQHMIDKIRNGSALSQSFPDDSKFPNMFIKMIKVGERTGKLTNVIKYMSGYYTGQVDNDVKNITVTIEPLIMLMLGLLVAGLVVTVIGPIYKLISNIGAPTPTPQ